MSRAYGLGGGPGGLAGIGVGEQAEAMDLQRQSAELQSKREAQNKQIVAANKAANRSAASTVGTAAGWMVGAEVGGETGGPYGALIGGALGYLAGGAFSVMLAFSLVLTEVLDGALRLAC